MMKFQQKSVRCIQSFIDDMEGLVVVTPILIVHGHSNFKFAKSIYPINRATSIQVLLLLDKSNAIYSFYLSGGHCNEFARF